MAITQLQDVANQVAEESHLTGRLRNEEIRRRMYDDWTAPSESIVQPQPTNIQDTSTNYEGGKATLASTYSKLLNNLNSVSTSNSGRTEGTSFDRTSTSAPLSGLPGWAPTAVGYGMSYGGLSQYAPLGAAATSLMQGNRAGAVGTLASYFTNKLTEGKIPGIGGLAGTLASGLVGDRSASEIGEGLFNSGLGTVIGMANPIAGIGYSLLRNIGFNPAYGLNNLFGNGLEGVAPGFEGTAGGFFGKNALGSGISSSGSSGYTPGYSSSDLGGGISLDGSGYGISGGGISTPSYSWDDSSSSSENYSYGSTAFGSGGTGFSTGDNSGFDSSGW